MRPVRCPHPEWFDAKPPIDDRVSAGLAWTFGRYLPLHGAARLARARTRALYTTTGYCAYPYARRTLLAQTNNASGDARHRQNRVAIRGVQNDEPGSRRKANSSSVDGRPSNALRCGKRPNRSMISACLTADR